LEAEGVEYIIGIPGNEINDVVVAIERSERIEYILARDENNAAFAASGCMEMGKRCVCFSTVGPGILKMVMPVTNAYQDRIPLVVLSGETDQSITYRELHQRAPVREIFGLIAKDATTIPNSDPKDISNIVSNAFKKAYEEKPGPCYIGLPVNIARMRIAQYIHPKRHGRSRRPDPDQPVLDFVSENIRNAKNPLIIAGSGILRERPGETAKALRDLVQQHSIPVVTTIMGKSAIPNSSPLYVGVLGVDPEAQEFIDSADVIITVGYEIAEYGPEKWNRHRTERIVHIDYVSADENYFYPLIPHADRDWNSQIVGDIKRSLEELDGELDEDIDKGLIEYISGNSHEMIEKIKEIQKTKLNTMKDIEKGPSPFHPLAAATAIRENLLPEDIVICSVGTMKSLCARYLQIEKPTHFYVPNTLSPMGFALPFALGAKLARPGNRVIAICGDGSFKMSSSELEVAVEKGMPITIIIFNNNQLGLITKQQQSAFGTAFGTRFEQETDYIEMAESMGVERVFRIDSYEEIGKVLNDTANLDEPVVIEIPVEE
ncbi:MAG: thiamine pyrophosphate-binding protein, partial [Candidatus Bipolaricaulia bacterium]